MNELFFDNNRGSNLWSGTRAQPKRTLDAIDPGFAPGADGGIYLASDSTFEMLITRASNPRVLLTNFNGTEAGRARIGRYVPSGALGTTKATTSKRMLPVPGDWTWDSTLNFDRPKGWFIQFDWVADYWDVWIQCAGEYAQGMNQSTTNNRGYGFINGEMVASASASVGDMVNGMTYDTLRWNLDYSGTISAGARLYLAGYGANNPAVDPSTAFGPGGIVIGLGPAISMYGCGSWTTIADIRAEFGSGILLLQGPTDSLIRSLEVTRTQTWETTTAVRVNGGNNTTAARWEINMYDNDWARHSGPAWKGYGKGICGFVQRNKIRTCNLTLAIAGGIYTQCTPSRYLGYEEPLVIRRNEIEDALNGTGNCTFDGCGGYADYEDDGTRWEYNVARRCYMAWQVGSGGRSIWHCNISIDCEYGSNWNNAPGLPSNDYVMTHSLHVAARRGTFRHGQGTGVHLAAHVMYQVGSAASLVRMAATNNITIAHPLNAPEVGMWLGDSAEWDAGKIIAARNLFIGFDDSRLVMSNLGAPVNKTSVADCLPSDVYTGFVDRAANDFRLRADSQLIGAGSTAVTLHRGACAFDGRAFQNPPPVGPYERPTMPTYFARLAA